MITPNARTVRKGLVCAAAVAATLAGPALAETCRTSTVRGAYRFEAKLDWAQGSCRSLGWLYFDGAGRLQTVDERMSGRCPDSARANPVANFRYSIDEDCNGEMVAANGTRIGFEVLPAGLLQFSLEAPNLQMEGQARYHHPLTAQEKRRVAGEAAPAEVTVAGTGPQPSSGTETVIVPSAPGGRPPPPAAKPAAPAGRKPNDIIITPTPAPTRP